ncbi:MAG: choice-of-anchor Q domain-containing protein, partial [bacterium]
PTITNCTISGNRANEAGGGIYCDDSSPTLTNNIIVNNSNHGIYNASGNPIINYNDLWNNTPDNYYNCSAGVNDISQDPQFISSTDSHLQPTSPCIDAGSNLAPSLPDTDMDGEPRIINGVVDMGADEYNKGLLISMELNGGEFHTGDTLTIDAHITNGSKATTVEAKCWIRLPNGKLKSLLNVPKVTLRPQLDVVKHLLHGYIFTGGEPEGEYEVGGRLVCPITLDYFSTDIETFTFTP